MKMLITTILSLFISICSVAFADTASVGSRAPTFTVKNGVGQEVSLQTFHGKIVVLEWFNPLCPFVRKFYSGGDMQRFQESVLNAGGIWLTISSSAAGKQGHIEETAAVELAREHGIEPEKLLLDSNGVIGRLYGARTTPHMFVIGADGTLAYAGAIDNTPSTRASDIPGATNYVMSAFKALQSGSTPQPRDTEPYGCSVKYGS